MREEEEIVEEERADNNKNCQQGDEGKVEQYNKRLEPINEELNEIKDEESREIMIRFTDNIQKPKATTAEEIKESNRLSKVKQLEEDEMRRESNMLEGYFEGNTDICKVIDPLYASVKIIEERLNIKWNKKNPERMEKSRKTGELEILKKS